MGCASVTKNWVAKLFWQFMGVTLLTVVGTVPLITISAAVRLLQRIRVSNVRVNWLVLQAGVVVLSVGDKIGGMMVRHCASQPVQVTLASLINCTVRHPLLALMVGGAVLPL